MFDEVRTVNDDIKLAKEAVQKHYNYIPYAYVHSFGCQQNVNDGEKLKGMFASMGYGITNDINDADVIFFNTCAVRENAEDRVFGQVGALKHLKAEKPDTIIGLCGCMVQQEHIAEKIKKSYTNVDILLGTDALYELPKMLSEKLETKKRVFNIQLNGKRIYEDVPIKRDSTFKAWVPIMYGCDNFCTYCIVPYVRGRERSRTSEEIVKEVTALVNSGYKEITLLGQNVNSYGKGLDEDINFSKLLRKLNDIDGEFRIGFMTSHPKDATKELIDTIAECKKVSRFLHLPLQSGSDRILKAMNRHYDLAQYMSLIDYAKEKIPDIAFSSDIIVGFPGETYEDFTKTLDAIKYVGYDNLYTFIYSKRVGTKAAEMDDPFTYEEKSKWFSQMLEVQREVSERLHNRYVGKVLNVLVDSEGRTSKEYISGKSDEGAIVDFKGDMSLLGNFVKVRITSATNWALVGEKID